MLISSRSWQAFVPAVVRHGRDRTVSRTFGYPFVVDHFTVSPLGIQARVCLTRQGISGMGRPLMRFTAGLPLVLLVSSFSRVRCRDLHSTAVQGSVARV